MKRTRRGAALYVTVMGLTLIVSAIGLSAIMVARTQLRMRTQREDLQDARGNAVSAIENALVVLRTNANWRTDYQNNVEYPAIPISLGDGTCTWKLIDQDGSLNDDPTDTLRVCGIGRVRKCVVTESVLVEATGEEPLSCLNAALSVSGNVTLNSSGALNGNGGPLSSNAAFIVNAGTVNGDVEADSVSNSGSINGTITSPAPPKDMPGAEVFDYYKSTGTWIPVTDLPTSGANPTISAKLLSPAANPFGTGTTNPEGIYVIDCLGQPIKIENSRFVGTLVLLNVGFGSTVRGSMNWEPAIANYPALLVSGDMDFTLSKNNLRENNLGINLNPPGTPYNGEEDSDISDTYPGRVTGIVYVSGNITANTYPVFNGTVVGGGTLTLNEDMDVNYDSIFSNNPPPGFSTGDAMQISRRSWVRGTGD